MRIKKFTGQTLQEAIEAMKTELGPEAIVLHTQARSHRGPFGFLQKAVVEITGAIDDEEKHANAKTTRGGTATYSLQSLKRKNPRLVPGKRMVKVDRQREPVTFVPPGRGLERPEVEGRTALERNVYETAVLHQVRDEVESVREMLRDLHEDVQRISIPSLPAAVQEVYRRLCANDVEEQLARKLVCTLSEQCTPGSLEDTEAIEEQLLQRIKKIVHVKPDAPREQNTPCVIAIVGPTGVGKTTTIAKLASLNKLLARKRIALITSDTYRIGALDQLRTFAAIAQIPLEVAYEPSDIPAALASFRDYDIVYLDTVGRSQRNDEDLAELESILQAAHPDEIHLALTPSTNWATLSEMAERFRSLNPNRLLFTKLDEAKTYGSILNLVGRMKLPVSYITNGQMIPDDVLVAEPSYLASLICGANVHV